MTDYLFNPKEDITTYELAKILAETQHPYIRPDTFKNLPDELKRHFVESD